MISVNSGEAKMVKAARFELRAEPEQVELWKAAAEAEGRSLGDWVARTADDEAERKLAIMPAAVAGTMRRVSADDDVEIERIRRALSYAIEELGAASPVTDKMEEVLRRLNHRQQKGGYLFDGREVESIRRAQKLAALRPCSRAPRR